MKRVLFVMFALIIMSSVVFSQSNVGNITQTGDENIGDIKQVGTSMEAGIIQSAGASPTWGYFNEAYIDQAGQDHIATVNQDGPTKTQYFFGNYADIFQRGIYQQASVLQEGRNKHTINQNVDRGAYVTQYGESNQAIVEQRGQGNTAIVFQDGLNNIGSHIIEADHRTGNTNGEIRQFGTSNQAYQRLETDGSGGQLSNSNFYSYQEGVGNVVNQTIKFEWGSNNSVSATQYGDGNTATQTQHSYNMSGNSATIIQGTDIDGAFNNLATQLIYGSHNTLLIEQYGNLNVASQTALTNSNSSTILQTGHQNEAVVLQQ
jgi:hypothetical protein